MYLYGIEIQAKWRLLRSLTRVLIVPLWNWNGLLNRGYWSSIVGSNCTFMELKLSNIAWRNGLQGVLIVPLWNWNLILSMKMAAMYFVLIVPLWNWNEHDVIPFAEAFCSNCTFMELKWRNNISIKGNYLMF